MASFLIGAASTVLLVAPWVGAARREASVDCCRDRALAKGYGCCELSSRAMAEMLASFLEFIMVANLNYNNLWLPSAN